MDGWFVNALQPADAALLVVDISDPDCTDHVATIRDRLDEKKITLSESWPGLGGHAADTVESIDDDAQSLDPFRIYLPTLLVANKIDLNPNPDDVAVLEELTGVSFPTLTTSALTGENLDDIGALLFKALRIVRVYTKTPGKPPQMDRPFTVRAGATVLDVARLVHKDIAGSFKYARAWGSNVFDGQQVGPEHSVVDGDIVELHIR
jgi:ribosome-interacting GTPase 1